MLTRVPVVALLLLLASEPACVVYEYEHEVWFRVGGAGTVNVTGRPALWTAFKGVGSPADPDGTVTREALRELFERSGLRVNRVTLTRRGGRPYLFVSADFDDLNALRGTPAFPDLDLRLARDGERLRLDGTWARPPTAPDVGPRDRDGGPVLTSTLVAFALGLAVVLLVRQPRNPAHEVQAGRGQAASNTVCSGPPFTE